MVEAMAFAKPEDRGLALGAWGAAQSTAAGLAIAFSGVVNDLGSSLASRGAFGDALADPVTGYTIVYSIEITLLVATLVVIGPLVRARMDTRVARCFDPVFPVGVRARLLIAEVVGSRRMGVKIHTPPSRARPVPFRAHTCGPPLAREDGSG